MSIEKLSVKEKAVIRNDLYTQVENAFVNEGYTMEPSVDGLLIHLENGLFAEVKVTIKNEDKFDLEVARQKYKEKMDAQAERAAKAAAKAAEKARKAAEKAAKAETET